MSFGDKYLNLNYKSNHKINKFFYLQKATKVAFCIFMNNIQNNLDGKATKVLSNKCCVLMIARWCNGSTSDFGSFCRGSNPCRAATEIWGIK